MQTIKFLAVLGAASIGLAPFVSSAQDSDDQAKFREAMRKAIEEQNAAEAAGTAAPAAPKPVAQPATKPTVVVPVPAEPETAKAAATKGDAKFSDAPVAGDDENMAKFRTALRQEIANNPAPTATAPTAASGTAVAAKAAPAPAPAKAAPAAAKPAPVARAHASSKPTYSAAPGEEIPSPFSAAKQQRLDALLGQYKADAITPQEYHAQRAAIIAEP